MYCAQGRISVAKLKENMVELDGKPQVIANLPTAGLIEGPFPFERNGIYYLSYPHVANKTEGWNTRWAKVRWGRSKRRE